MSALAGRMQCLLLVLSCGCTPIDDQPCGSSMTSPIQCINDRMHVDGTSTASWKAFGRPLTESPIGPSGDGQACELEWNSLDFQQLPGGGTITVDHYLNINCSDGAQSLTFTLSDLRDPRHWPEMATIEHTPSSAGLFAVNSPGTTCNANSIVGLKVKVTTEVETGGSAELPAAVTSDYARAFLIELDTAGTVFSEGQPRCDSTSTSFSMQLRLTQTAADWAPTPCMFHGFCGR